jgi:hypothetical protein
MVLAVVLLSAVLGSSLPLSSVSLTSPEEQPSVQTATKATEEMQVLEGIEATQAVHAVLVKIRNALGGNKRLLGVKSLVVEGDRKGTFLSYRILLPDRIQCKNDVDITFTLDGASHYFQVPERNEAMMTMAKKNTIKTFVTQSITLLVRAPSILKVRATLPKTDRPGTLVVMFATADGFAIQLEVDSTTFVPKAYSIVDNLTEMGRDEPGGVSGAIEVVTSATRRVTFDEYRTVAGIRFPAVMTDTISVQDGRVFTVPLRHSVVRVNEGVTAADFQK